MEIITPTKIEEAARDVIFAVENVESCERLPPGHVATPDWRMTLKNGRVADVEVTRCIDPAKAELFDAAHTENGTPKKWHNKKLSYQWLGTVVDRDPAFNKKRRLLKQVVDVAITILAEVEAKGDGSPDQMKKEAQALLNSGMTLISQGSDQTLSVSVLPGAQIHDGNRSQLVALGNPPEWVGAGLGCVVLTTLTTDSSTPRKALVSDVQGAINRKTVKKQMDGSPDLKWLVVMVDGFAVSRLNQYRDHAETQHAGIEGISFSYFDEVWVSSWRGDVVLRLSNGGTQMVVHHL